MLKHAKILVTTLVLSLMVGLMPTGSVLAAESEVMDDVIMLDDATENAGDDGDTIEPEEHYWVRYASAGLRIVRRLAEAVGAPIRLTSGGLLKSPRLMKKG